MEGQDLNWEFSIGEIKVTKKCPQSGHHPEQLEKRKWEKYCKFLSPQPEWLRSTELTRSTGETEEKEEPSVTADANENCCSHSGDQCDNPKN